MKIGEVCERTGLTKRAVRFYIECGLVDPAIVERNLKDYREYSAADEQRLRVIAVLRQSQFTIEQIGRMLQKPETIPEVLGEYRAALTAQTRELASLKEGADALLGETESLKSAEHVAEALREYHTHGDPDMTPHFRRYDDESMDEQIPPRQSRWGNAILAALLILALTVGTAVGVGRWNDWVRRPRIGDERARLVEYQTGPEERAVYYLPSGSLLTVQVVEERSDSFELAGVGEKTALEREGYSSTAYSTYTVERIGTNPESNVLYTYDGRSAYEAWTVSRYDSEGFGKLATITEERGGIETKQLLKDPEHMTETERFVTDAITALRNVAPLWRMMLLPVAASLLAAAFLWFLLKKLLKI